METENLGIENEIFDTLLRKAEGIPFYRFLGLQIASLGTGNAVIEVETPPEYGNVDNSTHGGVIMAAADAAMAMAVRSLGANTTTVQLNVLFMRHGVIGEKITAEGRVVKAGRRILFCNASVRCGEQEIAMVEGTFFRTGDLLAPKEAPEKSK